MKKIKNFYSDTHLSEIGVDVVDVGESFVVEILAVVIEVVVEWTGWGSNVELLLESSVDVEGVSLAGE